MALLSSSESVESRCLEGVFVHVNSYEPEYFYIYCFIEIRDFVVARHQLANNVTCSDGTVASI